MIQSGPKGHRVISEKTRRPLSRWYKNKADAEKRLGQIEYFKHIKAKRRGR